MGNCLVTKLKGVVDNGNLIKLGELRISRGGYTNSDSELFHKFGIYSDSETNSVTATIEGNNDSVFSSRYDEIVDGVKTLTEKGDQGLVGKIAAVLSPTKTLCDILITDKYHLSGFNIGIDFDIDLNELQYSPLLSLNAPQMWHTNPFYNQTGELEKILASSPGLLYLALPNNKAVTGNISVLAGCPQLLSAELRGATGIVGDVLPIVQARVSTHGQISGNFGLGVHNGITLNGHTLNYIDQGPTAYANGTLYWDGSNSQLKVYYLDNLLNRVWCYGYSTEEIATNVAVGGIWAGRTPIDCN